MKPHERQALEFTLFTSRADVESALELLTTHGYPDPARHAKEALRQMDLAWTSYEMEIRREQQVAEPLP